MLLEFLIIPLSPKTDKFVKNGTWSINSGKKSRKITKKGKKNHKKHKKSITEVKLESIEKKISLNNREARDHEYFSQFKHSIKLNSYGETRKSREDVSKISHKSINLKRRTEKLPTKVIKCEINQKNREKSLKIVKNHNKSITEGSWNRSRRK